MPLGVLNNISAIYAENNLNQTQSSLQNTLTQLSSGSRINSGADDSAGLAIANGLQANSSALSQSSSNATAGVGFLQVADGALSQVTNLLNRAVTLATEAGGGTLSTSQMSAADQEYQDILGQINTIGSTTEYNNIQVFGSDNSMSALTWVQGTGTAGSSATATASQVAAGSITAGGTTNGAAEVSSGTYGTAANLGWTAGGSGLSSILTTGPIAAGAVLSGTLAFTPNASSGSPNPISVNLGTTLTAGTALSAQAAQLQAAMNTQAGGADYAVSVVNGDELQIGFGANASAHHLTGLTAPAGGASTSGTVAAQTGYTLTAASGDSLTGTLTLTPQSTTPAGTPSNVVFAGSGSSSVTSTITSGDVLAGTVSISASIAAGTPTALSWGSSGSGTSETFAASVTSGDTLSGSFTIAGTGDSNSPYTIDLTGVTADSNLATTIAGDITSQGGTASDYAITYSSGTLTIGLSGGGSETGITVANTGGSAASQATPASTLGPTTVNLNGVTTANLQSTIQTALGNQFTVSYSSGSLSIGLASAPAGSTVSYSSNSVTEATPASVSSGSPVTISLAGVNTANLASKVSTALNGSSQNPDYNVTYASGLLTVSLTAQAATDGITGIGWSSTVAQTSSNQASFSVADGDTLQGTLTINQTIGGTASSPVTVNLNGTDGAGTSTANSGAALISAVNTALGNNAKYYTVGYNVASGTGTLSIAVNATGAAANVDSVGIVDGTSNNALSQTQTTVSTIASGASVLGNFTLTPTGSSTTPVAVDLADASTAKLAAAVQSALGASYLVGYDATSGKLSIGVSATGAAAGITGFTLAENATQAASVLSAPTGGVNIYTSDGTSKGSENYNVTVGSLSVASVGTSDLNSALGTQITTTVGGATGTGGIAAGGSAGTSLTGTSLTSQANAEAALQTVNDAISSVAYQRGQVGANINTLTAASNIAASEETNVQSAQNNITQTDYAAATSNMSKYEILTQTGISALAQANSTQQMVLKLLQ